MTDLFSINRYLESSSYCRRIKSASRFPVPDFCCKENVIFNLGIQIRQKIKNNVAGNVSVFYTLCLFSDLINEDFYQAT